MTQSASTAPAVAGSTARSWQAQVDVSLSGVPYCSPHLAELDSLLASGKWATAKPGMPSEGVLLGLSAVAALLIGGVGYFLWGGIAAGILFFVTLFALVLVVYYVIVGPGAQPRVGEMRLRFYPRIGQRGALGMWAGVQGHFEVGDSPTPTFQRELTILGFQNAEYAELARAENQLS